MAADWRECSTVAAEVVAMRWQRDLMLEGRLGMSWNEGKVWGFLEIGEGGEGEEGCARFLRPRGLSSIANKNETKRNGKRNPNKQVEDRETPRNELCSRKIPIFFSFLLFFMEFFFLSKPHYVPKLKPQPA